MANATAQTVKPEGARTAYTFRKSYLKADANLNASATHANAVVTVNADATRGLVVDQVIAGYSVTPTAGGTVTLSDGTTSVVLSVGAGTNPIDFDPPIQFKVNGQVTCTLADGGAAVVGSVYLNCHLEGA